METLSLLYSHYREKISLGQDASRTKEIHIVFRCARVERFSPLEKGRYIWLSVTHGQHALQRGLLLGNTLTERRK